MKPPLSLHALAAIVALWISSLTVPIAAASTPLELAGHPAGPTPRRLVIAYGGARSAGMLARAVLASTRHRAAGTHGRLDTRPQLFVDGARTIDDDEGVGADTPGRERFDSRAG